MALATHEHIPVSFNGAQLGCFDGSLPTDSKATRSSSPGFVLGEPTVVLSQQTMQAGCLSRVQFGTALRWAVRQDQSNAGSNCTLAAVCTTVGENPPTLAGLFHAGQGPSECEGWDGRNKTA